jgi:hypothetical protein
LIFGNPDAALRQAVLHEAVRSDFRTKLRHTFFLGTLFSWAHCFLSEYLFAIACNHEQVRRRK